MFTKGGLYTPRQAAIRALLTVAVVWPSYLFGLVLAGVYLYLGAMEVCRHALPLSIAAAAILAVVVAARRWPLAIFRVRLFIRTLPRRLRFRLKLLKYQIVLALVRWLTRLV
jgi:hypothetical protein